MAHHLAPVLAWDSEYYETLRQIKELGDCAHNLARIGWPDRGMEEHVRALVLTLGRLANDGPYPKRN